MFCMVFLENRIEMGGRQPSHLISILGKLHGYVEEEERIILVKLEFDLSFSSEEIKLWRLSVHESFSLFSLVIFGQKGVNE